MLLYKHVSINTYSWFSNQSPFGSSAWSTTNIPTEIPKKPVNIHFRAGKTKKRYLLFQDLDKNMKVFENGIINTIKAKEDNW
ncbi:MAG: hypothetical protein HYU67_04340 [Flavobacteriia bacterium]|nr:hypothetical protein [Flavobacteriia bacterium]